MRGLRARLTILVGAAVLVGLVTVDIAFVFWGQQRYRVETTLALRATLLDVVLDPELAKNPGHAMAQIAARHHTIVSLVDDQGTVLATDTIALPNLASGDDTGASHGFLHEAVPLAGTRWRYAVASRSRAYALQAIFADQPWAVAVLLGAALVTTSFATFFLRRAVLMPLRHITDLVHRHQFAGLQALSSAGTSDDLARLGQAIITMNQTISDERQHIAAQVDELTHKNAALADAQQEVVRAERLAVVGQLAAGLAHEVGNPLAILSGYVDMFKSGTLEGDDRLQALTRMGKELDRIHATMRSLLDFSRSKTAVEAGPGDMREALTHVSSLVRPQLRGVVVAWPALPNALAIPIATDAATQLVLNLILNAMDAVDHQGRIAIVVDSDEHGTSLHIDDSGPGVPESLRARIFEPFFTTKPAGKGTGLGLAVCERIVSAGGGDIRVSQSALGGARFSVTFWANKS